MILFENSFANLQSLSKKVRRRRLTLEAGLNFGRSNESFNPAPEDSSEQNDNETYDRKYYTT